MVSNNAKMSKQGTYCWQEETCNFNYLMYVSGLQQGVLMDW
jgi:hypothetical protein